ncbi:hypothetical protein ACLKA7_001918 [Drosophila subpalustris]
MLIDVYEQHPNLYDAKSPLYHNKHCRSESLSQIVEQMKSAVEGIKVADVKSKLGTLRSQYLVHLKKETNSNSKSGIGTDEKVKPFWLDNLQFLKPYLKIKEQRTSNFDIHNDSMTSESHDATEEEACLETGSCLNKVEEPSLSAESILKTANDMLGAIRPKRRFQPDVDAFGELVKSEMERIEDPKKRMEMRMKILQNFYEAYD